jgi:hypothetical protein
VITVLLVAGPGEAADLDRVAAGKPSLELLHSGDVEETLERLSRNRRIDAVLLLLPFDRAGEVAAAVLEEDPSAPPLFAPEASKLLPHVRPVPGATPEELLDAVTRELSA